MIHLPSEILTALETVLDYCWTDECRSHDETPEEDRHNHIFNSLLIMQGFVNSPDTIAIYQDDTKPTRYEVQTEMLSGWENCWTDGDCQPVTYATREEAEDAIKDHITDCINAVEGGDMLDSPDPISLRVVEVLP